MEKVIINTFLLTICVEPEPEETLTTTVLGLDELDEVTVVLEEEDPPCRREITRVCVLFCCLLMAICL